MPHGEQRRRHTARDANLVVDVLDVVIHGLGGDAQDPGHLSGDGNPQHLVFVDTEGNPLRQSNLLRRSFFPLMKQAGVPRIPVP